MEEKKTYFEKLIDDPSILHKSFRILIAIAAVAALAIILIAFGPDLFNPELRSEFGAFGDFVGGLLNPVLTFITFIALMFTIILQQRELSLARTEFQRTANALEKENFESTFFRLMETIRDNVSSIDIEYNKEKHSGFDAFKYIYDRMFSLNGNDVMKETHKSGLGSYEFICIRHGHEFGHYFRLLYNTFKYLSLQKSHALKADENAKFEFDFYAKLLRAQLSDYELLILYYNGVTERGRNFQKYIYEFELFDNLDKTKLLNEHDLDMYKSKAFGEGEPVMLSNS